MIQDPNTTTANSNSSHSLPVTPPSSFLPSIFPNFPRLRLRPLPRRLLHNLLHDPLHPLRLPRPQPLHVRYESDRVPVSPSFAFYIAFLLPVKTKGGHKR